MKWYRKGKKEKKLSNVRKINQGKNMPSYKILVLIDDEAVVGVYNFLLPQPKSHFSTSATHGSLSDGVG